MPELPEVETTMCGIKPHIKQQTIAKVIVRHRQLRWLIPANIEKILSGKKIIDVERRAKYLLLKTTDGTIIIHLGMSGSLRILTKEMPAKKHDHIDLIFRNKKILRYNDPRRFGAFLWVDGDPHQHPLLKDLGVEPLTKQFTGKYLWREAQGRSVPIKSFIMNNHIVTGVGNIYATEALYAAGIYPAAPAKNMAIKHLDQLVKSIKKILRHAIKKGGTTLKDFTNSDGKPGYFSNQLKVYGCAGHTCQRCSTILRTMRIGQRSTVYCEKCQVR